MDGRIEKLWSDVAKCKYDRTCSRLGVRTYWFEPNPGTIELWHQEGRFTPSIDRRAVFVCESPTQHAAGQPQFTVPGSNMPGWRCWGGFNAAVTDDFWKARERYGLQHCHITNVVKCGAGPGAGKPVTNEIRACAGFLQREIEIIQPAVIVLVGKVDTRKMFNASVSTQRWSLPVEPAVLSISHYSYARRPGGRGRMMEVWEPEFEAVLTELRRRGLTEPVWL